MVLGTEFAIFFIINPTFEGLVMIYQVKAPILGFEQTERIEVTPVDDNFIQIRDVDNSNIAFTLVNPYSLREYSFDVPTPIQVLQEIHKESKINVYNIIVIQKDMEKSIVNFLAPLIFNEDNATVGQIVLSSKAYPDYDVAQEMGEFLVKN
jgi:flagellar assembly factor FliW